MELSEPEHIDAHRAIVVGCDGHPASDAALRFAVRQAQLHQAQLIVVTAFFRPVDPDLYDFETPEEELRTRARRTAEEALCRALDLRPTLLPPHITVTGEGAASRLLLSGYGDAEMIVVGTHQRHLLQRLLHGHSTSRALIRHSHIPVVVVPRATADRPTLPAR